MSNDRKMIESLIDLLNQSFEMEINLEENTPKVQNAWLKEEQSLEGFLNGFIQLIEKEDTGGALTYYFGDELDFDTPEEYHRH